MSEDWVAVGEAVSQRMRERGISQKQLAKRSGVSTATIRLIQRHPGDHRHTPRTLEAISRALDWPPDYLDKILNGRPQQETVEQVTDDATLQSRLGALEQLLRKSASYWNNVWARSLTSFITATPKLILQLKSNMPVMIGKLAAHRWPRPVGVSWLNTV